MLRRRVLTRLDLRTLAVLRLEEVGVLGLERDGIFDGFCMFGGWWRCSKSLVVVHVYGQP